MTSLVEIIRAMTTADGRVTRELPRGLWLVYYPPDAVQQAHRLIIGRYAALPSTVEQRVVHDALLDALDQHPSRVVTYIDTSWSETTRGDWEGYQITWRTLSTTDAFSPGPGRAHRRQQALRGVRRLHGLAQRQPKLTRRAPAATGARAGRRQPTGRRPL